jgi:hypothetical protein
MTRVLYRFIFIALSEEKLPPCSKDKQCGNNGRMLFIKHRLIGSPNVH